MTRATICVMALIAALPSDGSAQAASSPGDRIRIKQVDGTILTGTLSTRSVETIQVSLGATGPMVEVPVKGIEALEISLGRQRRFLKYFVLTVAAASIVGATFGFIAYEFLEPCSSSCFGQITRGESTGWGFA